MVDTNHLKTGKEIRYDKFIKFIKSVKFIYLDYISLFEFYCELGISFLIFKYLINFFRILNISLLILFIFNLLI